MPRLCSLRIPLLRCVCLQHPRLTFPGHSPAEAQEKEAFLQIGVPQIRPCLTVWEGALSLIFFTTAAFCSMPISGIQCRISAKVMPDCTVFLTLLFELPPPSHFTVGYS